MSKALNKAYSYIRFSSEKQKQGDSLRRQAELAHDYCEANKLTLVDNYQDLGVSAYRGKNSTEGKLNAFIEAVDSGKIPKGSYLLVESLDRLSRDKIMDALSLLNSILKREIIIVTLMDKKVFNSESLNDPYQLIQSLMVMTCAHEESLKKSDRANANWDIKLKAIKENKAPYSRKVPSWIALEDGEYKLIPGRAEIIKLIFDLALGGKGRTAITTYLNEKKVKNWSTYGHKKEGIKKAKTHWNRASIHKILVSKASYGTLETVQIEEMPEYFPAAISEADYLKVQEIRSEKRVAVGSSNKTLPNLFSGLAVCGKCGARLHYINKGKGNTYLVCSAALNKGCEYNSWQYGYTEKHIIYSLREMDYKAVFSKEKEDYSSKIIVLEEKAKQLDNTMESKAQLLYRDDIPILLMEKLLDESKKVAEELEQVKKEIQTLQHATILAKEDISLEKLGELFDSAGEDRLDKRLALNQLLKSSIDEIKFIPLKRQSQKAEDGSTLGFVHSRIEIHFKKKFTTKIRSIIIYDERVKYSRLQNKSTSSTIDTDTTRVGYDIYVDNEATTVEYTAAPVDSDAITVDTDIIIRGDGTVDRHKAITDGKDFTWELES